MEFDLKFRTWPSSISFKIRVISRIWPVCMLQLCKWTGGLNRKNQSTEMKGESSGLIIGISIGVVIGVVLAISALFCIRYHRKRSQIGNSSSRRAAAIPIRANGADSCSILSDSTVGPESPVKSGRNGKSMWLEGFKRSNVVSASGIPEYSYKYDFLISFLHWFVWTYMWRC